jgi:CRP/FNR family transcriptional regulator
MHASEQTPPQPAPVEKNPVQLLSETFAKLYPQLLTIDDPNWQSIINSAQHMAIPAETRVMTPKTPCSQFMLILEGCVRVYQQTPDDREITLYRSYPGDICVLSVNGLMHQADFGAFAKTETDVTVLTLSREQFIQTMMLSRVFCEFILTNMSDRVHDVLQLVETTVFDGLDTRLMCHLNRLSRRAGNETLKITHQELARELGTSREVISRLLKSFERQGCLVQERGVIHLSE